MRLLRRWGAILTAVSLVAVGCGGGGSHSNSATTVPTKNVGWVATAPDFVAFLQWNVRNGSITGSGQWTNTTNSSSTSLSLRGTVEGASVTLTVTGSDLFGGRRDLTGTLSGDSFVLNIPQSDGALQPVAFWHGSVATYHASTVAAARSNQARAMLAQGLAAHRAGNLTLATQDYNEVLKLDPRNQYAYYNLGLIAQAQSNSRVAESDYRLALGIAPNFGSALFNLAIIRTAVGDKKGAIALYRHVIAVDPERAADAYFNLGLALLDTGQAAAGNAAIAKAIKLDPGLASRAPPKGA